MKPTHPILNLDEVEYEEWGHGERFAARLGPLATRLGARKLGYRVVVVPPGKTAWPCHFHHVNEEMFLILDGHGTLRMGGEHHPLRPGDVVCLPAGVETAHQIFNTSGAALKYLAVSTMEAPDIVEYPDSGKFAVYVGSAPGGPEEARTFEVVAPRSAAVDYWAGED